MNVNILGREENGYLKHILVDSSGKMEINLDNFSGDVNNTGAIGDGSTQLRTMAMGYDRTNGKARSVLVDSEGKQSVLLVGSNDINGGTPHRHLTIDSNGRLLTVPLMTGTNNILTTIDTAVDLTNTKLDTIDSVLDNILTKNGEIDTAVDLTNTKLDAQATHNTNLLTKATTTNTLLSNSLGSTNNLMNSVACVLAGTESSVVDFGSTPPTKVVFLVNSSTTSTGNGIDIWLSNDNSNWSQFTTGIYLSNMDIASNSINASRSQSVEICKCRYVKIKVFALGTFTASVIGVN